MIWNGDIEVLHRCHHINYTRWHGVDRTPFEKAAHPEAKISGGDLPLGNINEWLTGTEMPSSYKSSSESTSCAGEVGKKRGRK
jgi:hypothetical protein